MRAINADEMKELEQFAVELGIPARILMENAGKGVASSIISSIKRLKRAVVLAGKGNNGGDGFVAARYLHKNGVKVDIFLLAEKSELSVDSQANLQVLEKMGVAYSVIKSKNDLDLFKQALMKADVLIDSIYGAGFKGEVKGLTADSIKIINTSKDEVKDKLAYQVVSVDCPSGVDISTGKTASDAVLADITVTFEYYKTGLLTYPASVYAGKIIIVDIGIPKPNPVDKEPLWKKERKIEKKKVEGLNIADAAFVASVLPPRRAGAHKGSFGKALILAGSQGMTGAAALCGQAALRVGAGSVVIGVPESLVDAVDSLSVETITWGLPETKDRTLSGKAVDKILERIKEFDVIAVGPGLSQNKGISDLIEGLLRSENVKIPVILDADAINSIKNIDVLKDSRVRDISITPHPGEMSRLINKNVADIQNNRIEVASETAVEAKVNVVLKGAYTVIASPDKELHINPTGTPAMASAGVGDVLTGAIAGLIAQGVGTVKALVAAVYIHGMCGSVVAGVKGEQGVIASDLLESLPFVMSSIKRSG
ncbi:NAD(P)H-hydrate dehydratase [Candidatus Margulisiibacteriota bacterium]